MRIDASPSVVADVARVHGTLHVFLANFDGLAAGRNAVQTPQGSIRITLPAAETGNAWFLPFFGEPVPLQGRRVDDELVFALPEVHKGANVWVDDARGLE